MARLLRAFVIINESNVSCFVVFFSIISNLKWICTHGNVWMLQNPMTRAKINAIFENANKFVWTNFNVLLYVNTLTESFHLQCMHSNDVTNRTEQNEFKQNSSSIEPSIKIKIRFVFDMHIATETNASEMHAAIVLKKFIIEDLSFS